MKYLIPKYSGFCSGVSIAVNAAYANTDGNAYMYGEVVHNPVVVGDLESKGLKLINSIDEIKDEKNARVLIRAHGVSKDVIDSIEKCGFEIIDKTCVNVKKIHSLVQEASQRGLDAIVVGTPNHPEVEGIVGWISTKSVVIHSLEDAKRLIPQTKFSENGVFMVSQTTYNQKKYREIYEYCATVISDIEFYDTICNVTSNRQSEARKLAQKADGFIVVGGKSSSNVRKLYEIIREYCDNVQYIETAAELDTEMYRNTEMLVIMGGASTPNSCIEEVIEKMNGYCGSMGVPFEKTDVKEII